MGAGDPISSQSLWIILLDSTIHKEFAYKSLATAVNNNNDAVSVFAGKKPAVRQAVRGLSLVALHHVTADDVVCLHGFGFIHNHKVWDLKIHTYLQKN